MRVVHDARDVLIDHFESGHRIRPPLVLVLPHHDDCQLAVHFCNCESPRNSLPIIISEVWRFVERPGKAIYNAQLSVRANANFDRPRLSAALTPPTVEPTSSAISSRV